MAKKQAEQMTGKKRKVEAVEEQETGSSVSEEAGEAVDTTMESESESETPKTKVDHNPISR